MTEKIGDQIKLILEKVQKIEEDKLVKLIFTCNEQLENITNLVQETINNCCCKELYKRGKELEEKQENQLQEIKQLRKRNEELEKQKCITIEDLERHFGKAKHIISPIDVSSKIIKIKR